MFWLSLRLAFQGGREAVIRLIVTILAVTTATVLLLAVLAQFHAFQVTSQRPCWECTAKTNQTVTAANPGMLWLYRKDSFRGQEIKRLDIADVAATAALPGVSRPPRSGEYYASPALASLIRSVPREELGDRFPGRQIGTIGHQALANPDALVAFVGRTPAEVTQAPQAFRVTTIATAPKASEFTAFTRFAFAIVAAGLLFPMLVLIATATRLSAARREERYAAMRLVGATPRQINLIASVDAVIAAALGAVLGALVFVALRSEVANLGLTGTRFFAHDVTPTTLGYLAVLLGTPLAAAAAALISLRQVRISPLGVSRKVTPPAPKAWRLLPFLLGIGLFIGGALLGNGNLAAPAPLAGFVLTMIGLLVAGPWLTMQATRVMAKLAHSGSSLLAARRLADNPRAAFRSVSGIVLAVFVGTVVAGIVPAILASNGKAKTDALTNVMTVAFFDTGDPECGNTCTATSNPEAGLLPQAASQFIARLQANPGVKVFPVYDVPLPPPPARGSRTNQGEYVQPTPKQAMSCDSLRELSAFGQCAPGVKAVKVLTRDVDNAIVNHHKEAIVRTDSEATTDDFSSLRLRSAFVRVDNPASLEKARTTLIVSAQSFSGQVPRTFGEIRQDEQAVSRSVQQIILAAIILTLLVAGCSLAVAVGGGLVERRRPFALLRLSGVPLSALYKAVVWESVVPLVAVTFVAAASGLGLVVLMIKALAPAGTPVVLPGLDYLLTLVGGLGIALAIVCITLPLIGRITKPDNVRFE